MCVGCQDNSMGEEYSATNGVGTIRFPMCKIKLWPLPQIIHKNYPKIGHRLKYKSQNYEASRRKK